MSYFNNLSWSLVSKGLGNNSKNLAESFAKGKGKVAEKIIQEAKRLNVGNLQSPLLARALYYTGEIGEEVMSKLYNAVAIALAYIYKLDKGENIDKPEIEIPDELIFDEYGNQNDK